MNISLTFEMEKKLAAYRQRRRLERGGRVLQKETAILEILRTVLDGEQVQAPVDLSDLRRRIEALEAKLEQ